MDLTVFIYMCTIFLKSNGWELSRPLLCIEGKTIHVDIDRVVTAFTDTAINKNLTNLHAQYMLIQWIKRDGRIIGNQEIPTS